MKHTLKLIGAVALVGAFAATPASAEWVQSLGIGQKTTNMGGAGVATASDYDVFYANPAGAANIDRTTIGVGVRVLNTTNLDNSEPGFSHGVDDTLSGSENGYLPSVGAYVPGLLPNVTLGVGVGVVSALAADWGNDAGFTTGANAANGFNPQGFERVEQILVETSPTIGIKLSDKLNVGVSVGLTTIKHLLVDIKLNAAVLAPGAETSLRAQTSDDIGLPIPPWGFATSPHEASFTVGAQYKLMPGVALGAVFRSESPTEYDVDLALHTNTVSSEAGKATIKLETPRHVQIGATVDVTPQLKISGDVKWTNWSNASGVGTDLLVKIAANPANIVLNGVANQLVIANRGDDTFSFHLGAQYQLLPNLELQAGYAYDPAVFDTANLSYLMYSSDRHIYSLGASLQLPDSALLGTSGDWEFTLGGQLVDYEDITVQTGQSTTFGLGTGAVGPDLPNANFAPNESAFEIGGYIWSVGLSAVYKFGAPEEVALK